MVLLTIFPRFTGLVTLLTVFYDFLDVFHYVSPE